MTVANAQRERATRSEYPSMAWETHPAWSRLAERHPDEPVKMPPPARSREDIRALIVGRADSTVTDHRASGKCPQPDNLGDFGP